MIANVKAGTGTTTTRTTGEKQPRGLAKATSWIQRLDELTRVSARPTRRSARSRETIEAGATSTSTPMEKTSGHHARRLH